MQPAILAQLCKIGGLLDAGEYPNAFNDGVLAPKGTVIATETMGAETENVQYRKSGSAAGSWPGAAGWQGQTGEPGTPGKTGSPGSGCLRKNYLDQLDAIREAYPRSAFWFFNQGMWLSVESTVLVGLDRRATFLISIPYNPLSPVRSWAFWTNALSHRWIGPRHTNAIDGSICAFNPSEDTWRNGDSLVELIDQYTVWAFCHLHLEMFGWWPGKQTAEFVFERLTELNDNEWCGCGPNAERYVECCKESDLAADRAQAALNFVGDFLKFKPRHPPDSVMRFLRERRDPPAFHIPAVRPMLMVGSCLRPIRSGVPLSSAATAALPNPTSA